MQFSLENIQLNEADDDELMILDGFEDAEDDPLKCHKSVPVVDTLGSLPWEPDFKFSLSWVDDF